MCLFHSVFSLFFPLSSFCHKPDDRKVLCCRDWEEKTGSFGQEATADADCHKAVERLRPASIFCNLMHSTFHTSGSALFQNFLCFDHCIQDEGLLIVQCRMTWSRDMYLAFRTYRTYYWLFLLLMLMCFMVSIFLGTICYRISYLWQCKGKTSSLLWNIVYIHWAWKKNPNALFVVFWYLSQFWIEHFYLVLFAFVKK